MKKLFFGIVVFAFMYNYTSCRKAIELRANPPVNDGGMTYEAQPFGVNLSGAEFGTVPGQYTQDYSYPTAADIELFKNYGFKMVRLPFKWERIQPELNGPLDAVELARMLDFIDAAAAKGIKVLPDVHNFARRKVAGTEYIIGSAQVPTSAFVDLWKKLAAVYKDKTNIWGYGVMNEPYNMPSTTAWFDIAQAAITGIRTVDTKTVIVIGGDRYSSAAYWLTFSDNLKNLADPSDKIIYEAHQYFDKDASGNYAGSYDQEGATPQTGVERLKPFVDWLKTNKKKGFVGEYGVPDDDSRWLSTLDNMLSYMKSNCINGTYWSAGPRWGTYKLAVQPRNGVDRPQMQVLKNYIETNPLMCR